ncbi:MAG: polysaccharide deacetylase family protein [Chloroflexi bacterium]|nr:polysaccharide deacetylase family protein [Chloroflexota bacterium]
MTSKGARSCLLLANRAGALSVWRAARERLLHPTEVVYYHRVSPRLPHATQPAFLTPISSDFFEEQVAFLARSYEMVPLDLLVQCIREGKPRPDRALAVTFDDGYRDNYEHAYPVLQKHRVPATIFLTAGIIDQGQVLWWDRIHRAVLNHKEWPVAYQLPSEIYSDEFRRRWDAYDPSSTEGRCRISEDLVKHLKKAPDEVRIAVVDDLPQRLGVDRGEATGEDALLTWSEIREMAGDGISLGAHTLTHPSLDRIDSRKLKQELEGSKLLIEERLKRPVNLFAYPGGSGANSGAVREMLRRAGFSGAATNCPRSNTACTDSFTIGRRPIPNEPVPVVAASMVGFFEAWRHLRSALAANTVGSSH